MNVNRFGAFRQNGIGLEVIKTERGMAGGFSIGGSVNNFFKREIKMNNEQTIKGKWNEFKGELQDTWGKISGDDLERTKGNVKAISGLMQQKYGSLKDDAKTKFNELLNRYGVSAEEKEQQIKKVAADKSEDAKNSIRKNLKN
jgi:uncharacterized protein YjbJ (UPF0337 family)